jgi:uncharacterized protein (DUF433 family)
VAAGAERARGRVDHHEGWTALAGEEWNGGDGSSGLTWKMPGRGHTMQPITLIDRGRGLQLSTSRITVADLVPYFRDGVSHDEIIRWIPSLTREEIKVIEDYYREHKEELDRRVMAHREEQIRLQRIRFPQKEETKEECIARLRQQLHARKLGKNGEGNSRGQ